MQYTRNDVISFRGPFLEKRILEVRTAVKFLQSRSEGLEVPDNIQSILNVADASRMFIAGHSFGATSSVLSSRQLADDVKFKGVILHDLWPFPLPEDALDHGVAVPCLSILSEPFSVSPEVRYTRRLLSASPNHTSFKIIGSVHSSFSDTPWWFPSMIGKRHELRGTADVNVVQSCIVQLTTTFMAECLGGRPGLSDDHVKSFTDGVVMVFDCGQLDRSSQLATT